LEDEEKLFQIDGLGEVVQSSLFHCGHSGLHRSVGGHHHHREIEIELSNLPEGLESVEFWHLIVDQGDIEKISFVTPEGKEISPKNVGETIAYGISLVSEDRKRYGLILDEDIKENNRLTAILAKNATSDFDFVLVPIISPYKEDRTMVRSIIGNNFFELFINASLKKCIERDIKGLYKKALAGEIDNFIGISDQNPYEPPEYPDMKIKTDELNADGSADQIINFLKLKNLL